MNTGGQFTADTPFSDAQIFLGAEELVSPSLTQAAISQSGEGLLIITTPVSATTDLYKTVDKILRTGYAINYQQQFGTAASVPGPSSVANTSDPLGLTGIPPVLAANLATIKGPVTGFKPKGMQVNSADIVYTVLGAPATSISFGITATKYGLPAAGATAPVVTNIVAFGTNGLPVAVAANPVNTRVAVATPSMIVTPETKLQIHLRTVNPAGSTVAIAGVILNISYNYA